MDITFTVYCPCCSQQVTAHDAGFAATTVTIDACQTQRSRGIRSSIVRKTDAYEAAVPAPGATQHKRGLVVFT